MLMPSNYYSPGESAAGAGADPEAERRAAIAAAYQASLGRAPSEGEYGFWLGNPNFAAEIANSPEAQAIRQGAAPGSFVAPGGAPEGFDAGKWANPNWQSDKYRAGRILAGGGSVQQVLAELPGWTQLSGDKIQAPDGRQIDLYRDFGGANALQWTDVGWAPGSAGAAAAAAGGGGGGGMTPFGGAALPGGAGGVAGGGLAAAGYPEFSYAPWTETFNGPTWDRQFAAPDAAAVQQDPAYQARLRAGQQALERGAAARGTLLTGGTAQDLNQLAQDYASQEYANQYGRALGEYQQGYQDYLGNYQRQLGEYQQRYGQHTDAYGRALGEYGQRYGQATDQYGRAWQQYQSQLGQQQQQFENQRRGYEFGVGEQQQGWQNQQSAQQSDFDRLYRLANLGYNAAAGAGSAGEGLGDYYTQMGNATAAGQAGAGNAWNQGLATAGQLPLAYAALSQSGYRRPR